MILSFSDDATEKIFNEESLTRKELKKLGGLNIDKAKSRLMILNRSNEKSLLSLGNLCYHSLSGTDRYSIDANSRKSKWRITFTWENDNHTDVQLVKIEDTH